MVLWVEKTTFCLITEVLLLLSTFSIRETYKFAELHARTSSAINSSDDNTHGANKSIITENANESYETGNSLAGVYWRMYSVFVRFFHYTKTVINTWLGVAEQLSPSQYHFPYMEQGRSVIVHLFEWKWNDIAKECIEFLGPKGFAAVQISPPNEHSILWEPWWNRNVHRPWFERYRPVSYKLVTRSGNEKDLKNMIHICNRHHVRISVDVVFNHMTYHSDEQISTANSKFDPSVPRYDAVPYYHIHFNSKQKCGTASGDIEDFQNIYQVRNCRLSGLNDLDQSIDHVRIKIINYLNYLIHLGVAGFRIDAAKHMWPADLKYIYSQLDNLNTDYFPFGTRPFIYQEVIDLDSNFGIAKEYTFLGRVTEFNYGIDIGRILRKEGNFKLHHLRFITSSWKMLKSHNALVFIDNHDSQRGHGAGENQKILTFREPRLYKIAVAFMLAWPYGLPRIMSSYDWLRQIDETGQDINNWIGPPHNDKYDILPVTILEDGSCGNGWICEHRWKEITNMVTFHRVSGNSLVTNWWSNNENHIAFSRENKAFIAINNDDIEDLHTSLQTGLPPGLYCDIITGNVGPNGCTGRAVIVMDSGEANIFISTDSQVPILATHIEAKIN